MKEYIYLHGFASSPQSNKAIYLGDRFAEAKLNLQILDLNQGDFGHLTLTRQIEQTSAAFTDLDIPVTLIGSSFGGLTAAWVAQRHRQVEKIILLAPAFGFPQSWYKKLSSEQVKQWQELNVLPIYHYGEGKQIDLRYQFLSDAENYDLARLQPTCPTLIIHGINDDVVPIQVSREYASQRDLVKLIELDSDHGLNNVKSRIWQEIKQFLDL